MQTVNHQHKLYTMKVINCILIAYLKKWCNTAHSFLECNANNCFILKRSVGNSYEMPQCLIKPTVVHNGQSFCRLKGLSDGFLLCRFKLETRVFLSLSCRATVICSPSSPCPNNRKCLIHFATCLVTLQPRWLFPPL